MGWDISPTEALKNILDEHANSNLKKLLGSDAALVKSYDFDPDLGKFDNVNAPERVIEKIREAGWLKSKGSPADLKMPDT